MASSSNPSKWLTNSIRPISLRKSAKRDTNSQRLEWSLLLGSAKSRTPRSKWPASWTRYLSGNHTVMRLQSSSQSLSNAKRVSNRYISITNKKTRKSSNPITLYSRIIKCFLSISLILMWILQNNSNLSTHSAKTATNRHHSLQRCGASLKVHTFVGSVIQIIIIVKLEGNMSELTLAKSLRSLVCAQSTKIWN